MSRFTWPLMYPTPTPSMEDDVNTAVVGTTVVHMWRWDFILLW